MSTALNKCVSLAHPHPTYLCVQQNVTGLEELSLSKHMEGSPLITQRGLYQLPAHAQYKSHLAQE